MEEYRVLKEYEDAKRSGTLPEMPDALDEKCREIIDEAFGCTERRAKARRVGKAIARAAMVVLILLGLSTVMVLSVDAFRMPVLNYLIGRNEKYTSLSSGEMIYSDQLLLEKVIERVNTFVPEGYTQVSCVSMDEHYAIAFLDAYSHVICFTYTKDSSTLNIDTEDTNYVPLDFGEFSAVFSKKDGCRLIWEDTQSNAICTLFADGMEEDAFWEFAYLLIS